MLAVGVVLLGPLAAALGEQAREELAGDEVTASVARTSRAEEVQLARFLDRHWDDVTRQSVEGSSEQIVLPG